MIHATLIKGKLEKLYSDNFFVIISGFDSYSY